MVIIEVAHGAHVDAWMIFLMALALWLTLTFNYLKISLWLSPFILALAILTKGLPILLLVILFWYWRWWQLVVCGLVVFILMTSAGLQVGWGLTGPLDGTGLFGALRIYADQWNFNSGLFHWLEVSLQNRGIVDATDWAKRSVTSSMLVMITGVWFKARSQQSSRTMLRLMSLLFMGYILLTHTVHPWYLLILLVFIPFLAPNPIETQWRWLAVIPWIYLSATLPLSYITYLNPLDLREYEWVRNTEWLPTLGLLALWLVWVLSRQIRQNTAKT